MWATPDLEIHVEDLTGRRIRPLERASRPPPDVQGDVCAFDALTLVELTRLRAQARAVVRDMRAVGEIVQQHVAVEREEEVKTRRRVAEQVKAVEYLKPALARTAVIAKARRRHDRVREASLEAEATSH